MNPLRLVILEDDAMLADLLADWIRLHENWKLAGHASNGMDGIKLCLDVRPELVLIDISRSQMDGLTAAEKIKAALPQLKLIVLTCHSDPFTIQRVQRLGLNGYVSKTGSLGVLDKAIQRVMSGGTFHDETFIQSAASLREPYAFHKILSDREIEVLTMVAQGDPDLSISKRLGISPYTVAAHRRNIRLKLGAHNDRDLTQYARKWGLAAATA